MELIRTTSDFESFQQNELYQSTMKPDEDMLDYLLMAFEERILIPVRSRRQMGGSWGWLLRFAQKEKEMFFMPRVAQSLFRIARKRGVIDSESSVRAVMSHHPTGFIDETICFLKQIRYRTESCKVGRNLITSMAKSANLTINLYDLVDSCLIAGIINPCSRGVKVQSHRWYEFHPCLYWDPRFR